MIGQHIQWYENALALAALKDDESGHDKTLFAQLTQYEVCLLSFGLYWVGRLYGREAVDALAQKMGDLIAEQEFCDCDKCKAGREGKVDGA